MKGTWFLAALVAAGALVVSLEHEASACGGCFNQPPPPPPSPRQPSLVTDHRMILSISKQQTTLYDELRYTGDPESFAWVLPIAGTAKIGVSSDGLFATLDAMTQVTVIPPPANCPYPPESCFDDTRYAESSPNAGSSDKGGVTVNAQETVGPYETVQLSATDPNALAQWLGDHGYVVPPDIKPIIDQYVAEKFDFLALKLVPGTGVQAMRPVRVTTQGASAVLPLRMVAAGTGANVGVTLWTVAEGRYEPQNFPFFTIREHELEWDWTTFSSNLGALRKERSAALGGRGWELESSVGFARQAMEDAIRNGYCQPSYGYGEYGGYAGPFGGGGAAAAESIASACSAAQNNYEAEDAGPGKPERTKEVVQAEDIATLLDGINGNIRITRTRADLSKQALDKDLAVAASADQSLLSPARKITREKNQPTCTVYKGCSAVGTAPRDEAIAQSNFDEGESFSCTAVKNRAKRADGIVSGIGLVGLAAVGLKRLRKRR